MDCFILTNITEMINSLGLFLVVIYITINCCQAISYGNVGYRPRQSYSKIKRPVCQRLEAPENGRVRQSGRTPGNRAIYMCDSGFTLNGTSVRICQRNGKFSGVEPTCDRDIVDCGQPDTPMNGFVLAFNTSVGSVVVYICDLGFNPVGPELSECLADGTFENDGPICVPNSCEPLSNPDNGFVLTESLPTIDTIATYSCRPGYILIGEDQRICQSNRMWSGQQPACQRIRCPDLKTPGHGKLSYTGYYPGDNVIYRCLDGYNVFGGRLHRRVCQESGQWSGSDVICRRRSSHYGYNNSHKYN